MNWRRKSGGGQSREMVRGKESELRKVKVKDE